MVVAHGDRVGRLVELWGLTVTRDSDWDVCQGKLVRIAGIVRLYLNLETVIGRIYNVKRDSYQRMLESAGLGQKVTGGRGEARSFWSVHLPCKLSAQGNPA